MLEAIISLDYGVESILENLYNPSLFSFFSFITGLGSITVILVVFVFMFFYLWKSGDKALAKKLAKVFLLNEAFVFLIKWFINRPRPSGAFALGEFHGSLPSGHATAAIFIYGFLIYYFSKRYPDGSKKKLIIFLLVLLIILIGLSRLYLNVHFLSDVLAGYLLGGAFLFLLLRSKN